MSATELAFWAGVDGVVCDYCRVFRHCFLQGFHQRDFVGGGFAFYSQPNFQLRFHSNSIWFEK